MPQRTSHSACIVLAKDPSRMLRASQDKRSTKTSISKDFKGIHCPMSMSLVRKYGYISKLRWPKLILPREHFLKKRVGATFQRDDRTGSTGFQMIQHNLCTSAHSLSWHLTGFWVLHPIKVEKIIEPQCTELTRSTKNDLNKHSYTCAKTRAPQLARIGIILIPKRSISH